MRHVLILAVLLSLALCSGAAPAYAQPWTLELALPASAQHSSEQRRGWFAWLTGHRMHAGRCGYDADSGSAIV